MEFSTGYASLYNNTLRRPHAEPPVPQRQSRAVETRSIARKRLFSHVAPEIVVRCIAAGCLLASAERSSLGLNLSHFREMDPVFHAQRHSLAWWRSFSRLADDIRVRHDSDRPVRARTMRVRVYKTPLLSGYARAMVFMQCDELWRRSFRSAIFALKIVHFSQKWSYIKDKILKFLQKTNEIHVKCILLRDM